MHEAAARLVGLLHTFSGTIAVGVPVFHDLPDSLLGRCLAAKEIGERIRLPIEIIGLRQKRALRKISR